MLLRILVIIALLITVSPVSGVGIGDRAPAWQGVDLVSNQPISFPQVLNNKPAVLVFWATWCPYCKAFMPYAKEIDADYRARGVQLITFNAKERGIGDAKGYAESLQFPMLAVKDADAIAAEYGIDFIPGLLVVDGSGVIVYRRKSTDLPAGRTVSQQWAHEVREVLDTLHTLPDEPS